MKINCMHIIEYGELIIDPHCFKVVSGGREINLYPKEFGVLYLLAKHPGWVFTKEQIYQNIYGDEYPANISNVIYCLIYGVRKKMEFDSKQPKYIQSIRGIGYKFVIPEE